MKNPHIKPLLAIGAVGAIAYTAILGTGAKYVSDRGEIVLCNVNRFVVLKDRNNISAGIYSPEQLADELVEQMEPDIYEEFGSEGVMYLNHVKRNQFVEQFQEELIDLDCSYRF